MHAPPSAPWFLFRSGADVFALSLASVREVSYREVVPPAPNAPGDVLGRLNVRGRVVPLFDPGGVDIVEPALAIVAATAQGLLVAYAADEILGVHDDRGDSRLIEAHLPLEAA